MVNNLGITNFPDLLEFIKGRGDLTRIHLGYFYPKELLTYKIDEDEISHILFLKGNKEENILYCYIELFNTHCFIVILNRQYSGKSFEKSYIWDVLKARELKKDISLDLSRDYLEQREYMVYPEVESDYKERLKRTSDICDLGIIF